ncbi:MAG: hypothetical protein ABJB47_06845 [Actinomycetota bacterium]
MPGAGAEVSQAAASPLAGRGEHDAVADVGGCGRAGVRRITQLSAAAVTS